MSRLSAFALVLVLFITADIASAWSYKEHIQFTRLAASALIASGETPDEMKVWLRKAVPDMKDMEGERDFFLNTPVGINPKGFTEMSLWVTVPDERAQKDPRDSIVEPFGVHERLLHYVDLELLLTGPAKRGYQHDLSGKPKMDDLPREMADARYKQAGMLPFRVEQCYQQLVKSIREGRLDAASANGTDDHAVMWAAFLAHYLQDNTQPQHATLDYKSQTYFADRRNAPNIHAQMEYMMADDAKNPHMELRREFWPLFANALETVKDPVDTEDLWVATMEVAMKSYDALPLIGLAAMHATGQKGTPEKPEGAAGEVNTEEFFRFKGQFDGEEMTVMEMKARQTAWAVKRTEKIWLRAWKEAKGK